MLLFHIFRGSRTLGVWTVPGFCDGIISSSRSFPFRTSRNGWWGNPFRLEWEWEVTYLSFHPSNLPLFSTCQNREQDRIASRGCLQTSHYGSVLCCWKYLKQGLKLRFSCIFSMLDSSRNICKSHLPIHRTTSRARLISLTVNLHILLDLIYKCWTVSQYQFIQGKRWPLLEAADVAKAPVFSCWNVSMTLTKGRW